MVLERESSPDEQEQKANNKLYPKASKRVSVNNTLVYSFIVLYYVNDVL
jgi:hypothetical protein